jgi:putative Holliday junction resolvase
MAIDYGKKRTGIAVTDPLQIIATGLTTLETQQVMNFLREYLVKEQVEKIIVGYPTHLDGSDTHATQMVKEFLQRLKRHFPTIPAIPVDEHFTSKLASRAMVEMGLKKKDRQNKATIDVVAATIMLQEYLENN